MSALIFACAFRERLVERALAGDAEAVRILARAIPADIPSDVALAFRNQQIELLAMMIRAAIPEISRGRLSELITLAVSGRHRSQASRLDGLDSDELSAIEALAGELRRCFPDFPSARQLRNILS